MGRRSYPRLGSTGNFKKPRNTQCEACDEQAIGYVEVQFTWMRGDDESYKCCKHHKTMAQTELMQFLAECENKYKKVNGERYE